MRPHLPFGCLGDRLDQDLSEFGYEVVVLVDKGEDAQNMRVLRRGRELYNWPVSTGAETPKRTKLGHISQRLTPTGFFRPTNGRLYENYFSQTWQTDMPYAIFFNGGIAIHATHESLYPLLGQRASGGCVRLTYPNAQTLFTLVRDEAKRGQVARLTREGCLVKDKSGRIQYDLGYRTLIVVFDSSRE